VRRLIHKKAAQIALERLFLVDQSVDKSRKNNRNQVLSPPRKRWLAIFASASFTCCNCFTSVR